MSAIRVSPPSEGPVHDGKIVGQDEVTYVYNQVCTQQDSSNFTLIRSISKPVPIPSYLIAIASGNLCYRAFEMPEGKSWTSGVWAEPSLIDDAWWEFKEDTTRFFSKDQYS